MKKILPILFLCFFNLTYAQSSYKTTEFLNEKAKTRGGSFEGIDKDGYIYTVSYKTTYIVLTTLIKTYLKVFDARTGLIHAEVPLENSKQLKNIGMEYVSLNFINDRPTVICKKRKSEKPERYYGIEINQNGSLIGEKFEIGESGDCKGFKILGNSRYTGVYQSLPESKNMSFLSNISCDGDDFKTFRSIELNDNFDIQNTFTFKLNYEAISDLKFLTSGDYLYLKAETREREKVDGKIFKKMITTHRLFSINRTDGSTEEINVQESLDSFLVGDFRIKSVDEGILLSGQIIEEKGFTGIFSAIYSDGIGRITDIQTDSFDVDFVSKYWTEKQKQKDKRKRNRKNKDDEEDEDGSFSTNFELIETFETSDNGLISVFQEYRIKVVTTTTTNANGGRTTTTTYYYYYEDILVVKTGEDGGIEYTKLLPFYQVTIDYDPGKGYTALKSDNDIYFLHGTSNEIDNMIDGGKSSNKKSKRKDRRIKFASITHLESNGDIDTEQVLDLGESRVSIDPNFVGIDEKNKQFVIVSPIMKMFKRKQTKIIRIEL